MVKAKVRASCQYLVGVSPKVPPLSQIWLKVQKVLPHNTQVHRLGGECSPTRVCLLRAQTGQKEVWEGNLGYKAKGKNV